MSSLIAWLRTEWQSYHPTVWLLTVGRLFNSIIHFMTGPFVMIYLHSRGIDLAVIGMIVMTGPVGSTLGNLIGGQFADRYGRKPFMITGLVAAGLANAGFAVADETWQFGALLLVQGFFGALYWPSSRAAIADLCPPEKRAGGYGLWRVSHNVGAAVGPLLGALVTQRALMFAVTGIADVLFAIVFLWLGVESLPKAARAVRAAGSRAAAWAQSRAEWAQVFTDRPFLLYILAGIFSSIAYKQMYGNYSLFLGSFVADPAATFARVLALNGILVVAAQIPINRWTADWTAGRQLVTGTLIYAASYVLYAIPGAEWLILSTTVVWTVGEMIVMTAQMTFVADLAPVHLRARYMGASSISWTVGDLLAGPFGALLLKYFGGTVMMGASAAVTFVAAAVFHWAALRARGRSEAEAREMMPAG